MTLDATLHGEISKVEPIDVFLGEDAADGLEIVGDFEWGDAVGAGGEGLVAIPFAALVALQLIPATGIVHDSLSERKGS